MPPSLFSMLQSLFSRQSEAAAQHQALTEALEDLNLRASRLERERQAAVTRADSLSARNAALLQASLDSRAERDALIASKSHEWRTLLNPIIGFTDVVLQESPSTMAEETRQRLKVVARNARSLLDSLHEVEASLPAESQPS